MRCAAIFRFSRNNPVVAVLVSWSSPLEFSLLLCIIYDKHFDTSNYEWQNWKISTPNRITMRVESLHFPPGVVFGDDLFYSTEGNFRRRRCDTYLGYQTMLSTDCFGRKTCDAGRCELDEKKGGRFYNLLNINYAPYCEFFTRDARSVKIAFHFGLVNTHLTAFGGLLAAGWFTAPEFGYFLAWCSPVCALERGSTLPGGIFHFVS